MLSISIAIDALNNLQTWELREEPSPPWSSPPRVGWPQQPQSSLIADTEKHPYYLTINMIRCHADLFFFDQIGYICGVSEDIGYPTFQVIEDVQVASAESHMELLHF